MVSSSSQLSPSSKQQVAAKNGPWMPCIIHTDDVGGAVADGAGGVGVCGVADSRGDVFD